MNVRQSTTSLIKFSISLGLDYLRVLSNERKSADRSSGTDCLFIYRHGFDCCDKYKLVYIAAFQPMKSLILYYQLTYG